MKVPYKVDGNSIYVPSDKVYELRLELASQEFHKEGASALRFSIRTSSASQNLSRG